MADSEADIGYLTKFKIGDGNVTPGPETFTEVAEVVGLTPPSAAFGEVQTTHLNTPGAMHTYRPTLADPGEVSLTINYAPGGEDDEAIRATLDRKTRNWEIEYPNTARTQFRGFTKSWTPSEVELEGLMQAVVVIRVSGAPAYVAPTVTP